MDPATQAYVQQLRQAALGYAGMSGTGSPAIAPSWTGGGLVGDVIRQGQAQMGPSAGPFTPPPNPALDAAQAQYGQYANAGSQGLAALTGGPNPFMNSYLSQLNPVFDQLRSQAMNAADERATQLGAFGGSRNDVTRGVALGDIANTQAQLNYGAFNDAQMRALALAQMGYGSQARSAFLPQMYGQGQINLLNSAIGPYGQTQTQQMHSDPLSQLLGLGLTVGGFALGGPPGAAAAQYAFNPSGADVYNTFGGG